MYVGVVVVVVVVSLVIVRDRCVELRISLPEGLGLVRLSNPAMVAHTHKKSRQNGIAGEWWEIPFSFFLERQKKARLREELEEGGWSLLKAVARTVEG